MMSRPRALLETAALAVAILLACLVPIALIVTVFGDCPTDPRPNGAARCYVEQRWLLRTLLAAALLGSVVIAAWLHRRRARARP